MERQRLNSVCEAERVAREHGAFLERIENMPFRQLIREAFIEYGMFVTSRLDRRCPENKLNEYRQKSNWMQREIERRFLEDPTLTD